MYKKSEEQLAQDAKQFVTKYYPLTSNKLIDPNQFNRLFWYCNISETCIRELNDVPIEEYR